jgi:hypothetical protein
MGTGKVVYTFADEQKWVPDAPGSVGHGLWKAACAKQ